ncbi:MAG: hypothetical protein ACJATA_000821 [Sphingobacteriales bacterium]|jgi:hypothetical protein
MAFQAVSDTVGKRTFYYALNDLKVKNSRARIKAGFPFNDYVIKISIGYIENGEKKRMELSPLMVPMIKVDGQNQFIDVQGDPLYVPERILVNKNFVFSELEVTVVESNVYKMRGEKVLELYEKHNESGQDIINVIIQK